MKSIHYELLRFLVIKIIAKLGYTKVWRILTILSLAEPKNYQLIFIISKGKVKLTKILFVDLKLLFGTLTKFKRRQLRKHSVEV